MARSKNGNLTGSAARPTGDEKQDAYHQWRESLDPNASYFRSSAQFAFGHLCDAIGQERADELTAFWSDDSLTWKETAERTWKIVMELP